jgi:phage FluMu protein Com
MNNKEIIKAFLFSLGASAAISSFFGVASWLLAFGFWPGFVLAMGCQFLFAAIVNPIRKRNESIRFAEIQAQHELAESQQYLEIGCAYCKERNIVPILFNANNVFDCEKCKETNAVHMSFSSVRVTMPLTANMDAPIIDDLKEQEEKDDSEYLPTIGT